MYGGRGSPCLRPWEGLKGGILFPVHKREKVEDETQCIMSLMTMYTKPKSRKQLCKKSQLTLSKVFSKSSLDVK